MLRQRVARHVGLVAAALLHVDEEIAHVVCAVHGHADRLHQFLHHDLPPVKGRIARPGLVERSQVHDHVGREARGEEFRVAVVEAAEEACDGVGDFNAVEERSYVQHLEALSSCL